MFEKCDNCGTRVLSGYKSEQGVFCSRECRGWFAYPGFCPGCSSVTTEQSSGGTFTFNGIGTRLYGGADPCTICGSVVQRLWFCVFFIPLIPVSKYRVKYAAPRRFHSRKLAV